MNLVYKLTREDNLCYIGLTLNLKKRIYEHKRSVRFKELKIINIEILGKNGKNGKKINYLTLFVNEYSQKFNMTTAYMRKLLKGKVLVWKYLYEEILDMKS